MTQVHFLGKSPRGRHALRHLISPPASGSAEDPHLVIDASGTRVVDAFTGTVTMANVEHHLGGAGDGRQVTITAPRGGEVHGRFCTMLALIPEGCQLELSSGTAPVRDPRVLLPATRVRTVAEADTLALFLRASSQRGELGTARLEPKQAGLLANALPDLVDNGLRHGADSGCGVIVCAALESDNREAQLVVTDLGGAVAGADQPLEALREAWARSRTERGALHYLTERASRFELDVSVQVRTGNAQGRWRRRWNSDSTDFSPGWTVGVTVHR